MRILSLIVLSSILSVGRLLADPTLAAGEIPPLSAECLHEESGMLGMGFAYKIVSCGGEQAVLLERYLGRQGEEATFQIVDRLALPEVKDGQSILSVALCESRAYKDDPVSGIGSWKDQEDGSIVAEQISHAWRFDLQQGKIEAIDPHELQCVGESAD